MHESGVSEDLQMVGDGALALADRLNELAYADFAVGGGRQHGQESQADRITESVEADRELRRLAAVEGGGEDRRATLDFVAHREDNFGSGHGTLPLTIVDVSAIIIVSTLVDVTGGFPCLVSNWP
jgi:hypothetical protein